MDSSRINADEEHDEAELEMGSLMMNIEGRSVPIPTEEKEEMILKSSREGTFYKRIREHFWVILLLFIVIGGITVAYIPRLKSNREDGNTSQRQERSLDWDWYKKYGLKRYNSRENRHRHSVGRNRYDARNSESKQREEMQSSIRRHQRPENIGRMNIYIGPPGKGANQRRLERFRFPAARYNRRQLPLAGPFLNFVPWMPIVADRLTRQTIIYSSTGVYILPSLVNMYGKLYSVAELIASGYASLVSTGVQPTSFIDMRSFFQSTPIFGPGVPIISTSTGAFVGSIRTNFGFFDIDQKAEVLIYRRDSEEEEEEEEREEEPGEIDYQPASYVQNRHDRRGKYYRRPAVNRTSSTSTTTTSSTYKSTRSSTTTSGTTPMNIPGEVHRTLIIDELFPFSTSRKPIISANYSFPGPLLEAYEGDILVIRVINRLSVPSTMHWHGMRQIGTPDMDGAVGITQCAIPPHYEITYRFNATPVGTTWYHGHLLEQYTDGLYGPLIIRRPKEANDELYDSEQILMLADWYNRPAHTVLLPWYLNPNNPDGNEPSPDAIVVNGTFTQSLFISLSGSRRVRFRIINTAAFSMYTVSIDGLPLHIIEVDTTATFPYTVNSFNVNVAQRVSFYINLDELDSTYTSTGTSSTNAVFIRIQAVLSMYPVDILNYIPPYERQRYPYPTFFNPLYVAILSFDSTNSTPTYPISQETPTLSGAPPSNDTNQLDARPINRNSDGIPNATHYLELIVVFEVDPDGINRPRFNNVTYSSDANYMHLRPDPTEGITSDLYAPLLHQMAQKPKQLGIPPPRIQAGDSLPRIQSDGNGHYLIPYQAVVDIFINNTDGGEHPFHLHGYNFWVVSTSDYPQAEFIYAGDYIQRDTVSVPALGWAKIRVLADNPGAWFFHCHIEWHMSAGLTLAFLVSPEQLLANGYTISQSQKDSCQALQRFNTKANVTSQ